jgi:hypothetical protein
MFSIGKPKFNFQTKSKRWGGLIKLFVSVVEVCKIAEMIFKNNKNFAGNVLIKAGTDQARRSAPCRAKRLQTFANKIRVCLQNCPD